MTNKVRGVNRREFVQTMTAIGATTLFCKVPRTAHSARLEKVGLQLYTVRDKMKEDFEATLARVAEIGYKEVEFAGYFDHAPADVRAILAPLGPRRPVIRFDMPGIGGSPA